MPSFSFKRPRKLTIGMAVYDDYDGIYFTINSIRMHHKEILDDVEFLIIDNNPDSTHGKATKEFASWVMEPIRYVGYTSQKSTSVRNKVFEWAKTPYVMCIDPHVLLVPGFIKTLLEYFESGSDNDNLIQGPLLYDNMKEVATHFEREWREQMLGTWGKHKSFDESNPEPFEIPMQGLGFFAARKKSWPGFSKRFQGFGCEEFYIAEKYRQMGKSVICHPQLQWTHRFARPNGVPYAVTLKDKYVNYIIGFRELGLDTAEIDNHFLDYTGRIQLEEWRKTIDS